MLLQARLHCIRNCNWVRGETIKFVGQGVIHTHSPFTHSFTQLDIYYESTVYRQVAKGWAWPVSVFSGAHNWAGCTCKWKVLLRYGKHFSTKPTVLKEHVGGCLPLTWSWTAIQKERIFNVVPKGRRGGRKQRGTIHTGRRGERTQGTLGTEEG